MEWLRIQRVGGYLPSNTLLAATDGALTFLSGDIEGATNNVLRLSADHEIVWDIELPFAVRDVAISSAGSMFVSGFDAGQNHPWLFTIAAYGSDGQLAWSRTDPDAAELVDIECSVVAHDAEAGWLAACVELVELGGDGIYRLYTYDDAGELAGSVPIPGQYLAEMQPTGDGDLILSGRDSGAATSFGTLARVNIATGVADWELEFDGPEAPAFARAADGTIGALSGTDLHGVANDGVVSWTVPVATEEECGWLGWGPKLAAFGDTFVIVGSDTSSPSPVIHQISAAGEPVCSDGPAIVAPTQGVYPQLLVAGAGEGAWVVKNVPGGPCNGSSVRLLRTVTP
jgi:hypothetical protein